MLLNSQTLGIKAARERVRISNAYAKRRSRPAYISHGELQTDRMPRTKAAGRPVGRIPSRCPFAGVVIEWRGIQAQSRNHGERVTLARVDRDPFAGAAFAVTAKFGRAHRSGDQAGCAEHIRDRAGTIISVVIK